MPDLPPSIYVPVVGALASVILYRERFTIPGLVTEIRDLNKGWREQAIAVVPVLAKANELIEKCRDGCPYEVAKERRHEHA